MVTGSPRGRAARKKPIDTPPDDLDDLDDPRRGSPRTPAPHRVTDPSVGTAFGLRPSISLSSLDGWARLHQVRATPLPLLDDYAIQQEWLTSLYVQTRRDELFAAAVEQTMRRNGGGLRRWLGVDGRSNLGKSDMLINWAIANTPFNDGAAVRNESGYQQIPVVYIETGPPQKGAGLMHSICEFVGIVPERNEDKMRRQLARVLPKLCTYCIVVDDAHFLKRVDAKSTLLPDTLRALLRLPVTFIFVGNNLEESALLKTDIGPGYESAEQVRERASMMSLEPLRLPTDAGLYDSMIRRFVGRVEEAIPGVSFPGLRSGALRKELRRQCGNKHGNIFATLKCATIAALDEPRRAVTADLIAKEWPTTPGKPHEIELRATDPADAHVG